MGSRRAAWPLVALAVGLPLWWALGLAELIYFAAGVPLVVWLVLHRPLVVPSWFGVWLAFLAVFLFSGPLMTAHAPQTLDLSLSTGSLTYAYRAAIYVLATVFMLYVVNVPERQLSTALVAEVLAVIFIVGALGGMLGVLLPGFGFTSPMERILPAGLGNIEFVKSIIHPSVSDVQSVLGFAAPRPKAPYAYANSWGANFTVTLPFFVWRYLGKQASWLRRVVAVPVLVMGAIGVTYSLNRGLWFAIAFAAAIYAFHVLRTRGTKVLVPLAVAAVVAVVGVAASPLGTTISERFSHQHSNERRGDLVAVTVDSVTHGSPVLGFGNTRRLDGSFFSIAGGATDTCPFCAVPPLGTQGHAWLVLFTQGLLGTLLFYGFLVGTIVLHLRRRDAAAVACVAALAPLMVETLVYDTLGPPFVLCLLVLGLMIRSSPLPRVAPLERLVVSLRLGWTRVAAGAAVGLLVGLAIVPQLPRVYSATADVVIPTNPIFLSTSLSSPKSVTVDTEAQTALAEPLLDRVRSEIGDPDLTFTVGALPASRVLLLTASSSDRSQVLRAADTLAEAVVATQSKRLSTLRSTLVRGTDDRIQAIAKARERATPGSRGVYGALLASRRADRDRVERTLLVDARQIRAAHLTRRGRANTLVPPMSGLAVGVLLGAVAAALRRPAGAAELDGVIGRAVVLGRRDLHRAGVIAALVENRHGPGATACVVTVGAGRLERRWVRRLLRASGMAGRVDWPRGAGPDAQVAQALAHDAVLLVLGPRADHTSLRTTLERLRSVGRDPDVIMVSVTRLLAGLRADRSAT